MVRVPQLQTLQRSIKVDHCDFDSGGEKGMQGSLWRQLEERAGGLAPSQLMPVGRTYPGSALLGPAATTTTTTTWALPVQTSPVPAQGRQSPPSEPAGRALRLLPIPISSFFATCPVLSLGVLGRWLLCSERWSWCHQTNGVLVQKDARGQVPDGCRVAGGKGERRRRRRGRNRGRRWRRRWW